MHNLTHFLTHIFEPQTLAWAMQDSPAGLAAWMLQRRRAWSDCGGDVERRFTKDELITSFALYWLTGTFGGSVRFYADSFGAPWTPAHDRRPTLRGADGHRGVPVRAARTCRARSPSGRRTSCTGPAWTAAATSPPAEEPELVVDDLRAFFRPLRSSQ